MGSDGLWDNMFDVKIIEILRPFIRECDEIKDPSLVAELISKESENLSN